MLQRRDIPKLFKEACDSYLQELGDKLKYRNDRFLLSEKELQAHFAIQLFRKNLAFQREQFYPDARNKRIDFKIYGEELSVQVEIEWEGKFTDGFAKRTFEDLKKLDDLPPSQWGMFLALNVGDKFSRPERVRSTRNPLNFALSPKGKRTVLWRKWSESGENDLLRCNPLYWYWPAEIDGKPMTVTILSCYGRRTRMGWKAA